MRIIIIISCLCLLGSDTKSIKKSVKGEISIKNEKQAIEKSPLPPAIVAIEIVDRDDEKNSTVSKNTKRTIESSLGYGYQNSFGLSGKPRFEIYKYSQQDIPPFNGRSKNVFTPSHSQPTTSQFNIQKSVTYNLGTITSKQNSERSYLPPVYTQSGQPSQNYEPGTTIFSTLNQHGQLGDFSQQLPQESAEHASNVPVIVLRVYSNQLADAASLYPNLPQSHPYSNLNTINLQSVLSEYQTQGYQRQLSQAQTQIYPQPSYLPQTLQPVYQTQSQEQIYQSQSPVPPAYQAQSQEPTYLTQAPYQHQQELNQGLQTHENYPDEAHTRVVFHKDLKKPKTTPGLATYKTPSAYSSIQNPQYEYTNGDKDSHPGYYYVQPAENMQQQVVYYPQYQYDHTTSDETDQAKINVQPEVLYNYHHHSVGANNVEVVTHEGKGPQNYHARPVRKARRSKKSKQATTYIKKEENELKAH